MSIPITRPSPADADAPIRPAKHNVLGVLVDDADYDGVTARVLAAARAAQPMAVSALAVHGVVSACGDPSLRARLNRFDLVVPDGQPVRWALRLLHRSGLQDRVYGPELTRRLLTAASAEALPVYFYGSTPETVEAMRRRLPTLYPELVIAGIEPSAFRAVSDGEQARIAHRIAASGARLVFVGLGCPRQERFAYAMRGRLGVPILAVGAAFDYFAGALNEPPMVVQDHGLQWLWRLCQEPRRLWRRYLLLNPAFLSLLAAQRVGLWRPIADSDVLPGPDSVPG
jgi:N-acetylglucosaminyldiphosphoundecaprenol N-acetyl-beta-D-mannosaminyltransferase